MSERPPSGITKSLLWAPWRMDFIRSADKPVGCALCEYAGRPPSRDNGVLVHRAQAFAVLNKYPYVAAHVMVIPMRHVSSLADLQPAEHDALFQLVRDSVSALELAVQAEGMNVGLNLGKAAGAGIQEHLHVHLVPRWVGDSNFMPVIADTRVMPQYLERTWDELAPHFAKLASGEAG